MRNAALAPSPTQVLSSGLSFQKLDVRNLSVRKGRRSLLKGLSLTVEPGDFVVVLGPNGAGKTTLLKAIGGERPSAGGVCINGHSLYAAPEYWLRYYIGQVPSQSVLHGHLTVRQALAYAGELRLCVSADELEDRITELLRAFAFPKHREEALIGKLSDGERKLANICAELLAEPPLLLLDEPTTGLDPYHVQVLMEQLRQRAREPGRAVIITSHTMAAVDFLAKNGHVDWPPSYPLDRPECRPRVVFMAHGRIVEQGSPDRGSPDSILRKLGCDDWPQAFEKYNSTTEESRSVRSTRPERWPSPFSGNGRNRQHPVERDSDPVPSENSNTNVLQQFRVLVRRNWRVLCNDGWQIPFTNFVFPLKLLVTLLLGPLAGMLLALVLEQESFIQSLSLYGRRYALLSDISDVRQAVFLLTLVVALLALTGSFREIASEIHIYRHERLKGLAPTAYLLAKGALLIPLFGLATPILLLSFLQWRQLPWNQPLPPQGVILPSLAEPAVTLVLTAIAAICLGLAISAVGSTREHATVLLAVAIVYHALLSGLVTNQQFGPWIDRLSALVTSRWAMEGISTSLGVYCWANPRFKDFPSVGHLASVWLWLLAYALLAAAIAYLSLRAKDRWSGLLHLGQLPFNGTVLFSTLVFLVLFSGWFVRGISHQYFDLRTYEDPSIADVTSKTPLQHLAGMLNEARCPAQEENLAKIPTPTTYIPVLKPTVGAKDTTPISMTASPTPMAVMGKPSSTPVPTLAVETETPEPKNTPERQPSTPSPQPTQPETASSPSPTPSPTIAVQPLPTGVLPVSTELRYGPTDQHSSMGNIPPGTRFTLLGKSRGSPGWWYRVKIENGPEVGSIGWIEVSSEDLRILGALVSVIPAPPACARGIANSLDHFSNVDHSNGSLGGWISPVAGDTVFLIDLYRPYAGKLSPGLTFSLEVNGIEARETTQSIAPTKKSFIWRGIVVHADLKVSDRVQLKLRSTGRMEADPLRSFVSVFSVPRGCEFN